VLRLAAGLLRGPGFVDDGYTFYAEIAHTFWSGEGLCYAPGVECAQRMPLYPIVVAPLLASGAAYPWLIVVQAGLGAVQPLVAHALARPWFGAQAAAIAAVAAALNPYAVWHDSSFQDTALFNALITSSVLVLIRSVRLRRRAGLLVAGLLLALAMVTTIRMALFVPAAVLWVVAASTSVSWRDRFFDAGLVAAPVILLLGIWTARNARVVGAPVLTTESGLSLWLANNAETMHVLPNRSVDLLEEVAWTALGRDEQDRIRSLSGDSVAQDREYARLAIEYVQRRPWAVVAAALSKVTVAFSGWLSPSREWRLQLGYLVVMGPITLLALIGWWRAKRVESGHVLIALLVASFAVTTAVFWAHTSHGSFLQPLLMVYAASMIPPMRSVLIKTDDVPTSAAARHRA
jgi:hypothetical protein